MLAILYTSYQSGSLHFPSGRRPPIFRTTSSTMLPSTFCLASGTLRKRAHSFPSMSAMATLYGFLHARVRFTGTGTILSLKATLLSFSAWLRARPLPQHPPSASPRNPSNHRRRVNGLRRVARWSQCA